MSEIILNPARLQIVRYMQVVSATLLVLEHLTMFEDEIKLIWPVKWSAMKVLYFIARYLPYLDTFAQVIYYTSPVAIKPHTCLFEYRLALWSTVVGMGLVEVVLILRTWAIYECSRKVLYTLGALWVIWGAPSLYATNVFSQSLDFQNPPPALHGLPGCYLVDASPVVFGAFAGLLIIEITVVIMTVRKALQLARYAGISHPRFRQRSALMHILVRDGILYFISICLCSAANIIVFVAAPQEFLDLLDTFTRVVHSILCCRIILNIRSAGTSTPTASGTVWGTMSSSGLRFSPAQRGQGEIRHPQHTMSHERDNEDMVVDITGQGDDRRIADSVHGRDIPLEVLVPS